MSVPECSTCRHSRLGRVQNEIYLRCQHPGLPPHSEGDPWYAGVIRGFETDEKGRPWCGAMGVWHEPTDEDETA